jgi:uracil-DNA glycosylase family 4
LYCGHVSVRPEGLFTSSKVLFVGESPGREEETAGRPFVGDSGQILRKKVQQSGIIHPSDAAYVNSSRCRLDKDTLSDSQIGAILAECRPQFVEDIQSASPKLIITLGAIAYRQLFRKKVTMKAVRGRWIFCEEFDCWVYPTWHPAYILRFLAKLPEFEIDLNNALQYAASGFSSEFFNKDEERTVRLVSDLSPIMMNNSLSAVAVDTETQGNV